MWPAAWRSEALLQAGQSRISYPHSVPSSNRPEAIAMTTDPEITSTHRTVREHLRRAPWKIATPRGSWQTSWPHRLAYGSAVLLATLFIFTMWLIDTRPVINLNSYEKARFVAMLQGSAFKPFVYRRLVPAGVNALRRLIPDSTNAVQIVGRVYREFPEMWRVMLYLGWEHAFLTEYAIAALLMYLSLLGFAIALRRLSGLLYRGPTWQADLMALGGVLMLPVFFLQGTHYIYDLPALFFFTLGFLFLVRDHLLAYYLVLSVGMWNKETLAALCLIFLLRYWPHRGRTSLGWPRFLAHLAAQGAITVGVKAYLWLRFRSNPGNFLEFHLWTNLHESLTHPWALPGALATVAVILLVVRAWRDKPLALRQGLIVLPPLVLLYIVSGIYQEMRIFYEAYPIVWLLVCPSLAAIAGWRIEANPSALPA
jgi:hypothetical protein